MAKTDDSPEEIAAIEIACAQEWLERSREAKDYAVIMKLAAEAPIHVERLLRIAERRQGLTAVDSAVAQLADLLSREVIERTARSAVERALDPKTIRL